jgi:hypothetical protein
MGSAEGALKVAAARVGLGVNEYIDRVNKGLRYCYRCAGWHPCGEFGKDPSRMDGLARACRSSITAATRAKYQRRKRREPGRRYVGARDGDALQARRRVNYLVEQGLLPRPNALPCADCGHVWAGGERRHEYDHHMGYEAAHHEDVEAVCTTCHHAREERRRDT